MHPQILHIVMNNSLHYFHLFDFAVGILQFTLGIYEVIVLNNYNIDNPLNIFILILLKSIFNLAYGSISIINICNIIKQNNITKYYNNYTINTIYFVNCCLSIWNFIEFCSISNLSKFYMLIIFLEFLLFQFVGSIYLLLLFTSYCSTKYTHQITNITIINANIITEINQESDIYNIINIEQEKVKTNSESEVPVIEIIATPVNSKTVEAFPYYDNIYQENISRNN